MDEADGASWTETVYTLFASKPDIVDEGAKESQSACQILMTFRAGHYVWDGT